MLMDVNIKIYTCQVLGYFCLQSCAGHMTYSNKTKKKTSWDETESTAGSNWSLIDESVMITH